MGRARMTRTRRASEAGHILSERRLRWLVYPPSFICVHRWWLVCPPSLGSHIVFLYGWFVRQCSGRISFFHSPPSPGSHLHVPPHLYERYALFFVGPFSQKQSGPEVFAGGVGAGPSWSPLLPWCLCWCGGGGGGRRGGGGFSVVPTSTTHATFTTTTTSTPHPHHHQANWLETHIATMAPARSSRQRSKSRDDLAGAMVAM